jgi:hypothetical protein
LSINWCPFEVLDIKFGPCFGFGKTDGGVKTVTNGTDFPKIRYPQINYDDEAINFERWMDQFFIKEKVK